MRIAGVDIGGTSIKIGVFEDDTLLHKTSIKTPYADPSEACARITSFLSEHHVQLVGVGTAGSVNPTDGIVSASNLGWESVPLKEMLSSSLNVPVWIDNDAQAALTAEWYNGVCQGVECALYLTLGTGIGGAMIIDGKPYRGPHHLAAEFGHMIIHPNGHRCACGRKGCLEYYASASSIKRMARGRSAYSVITAAKAGEAYSQRIFNRYIHELCIGLSNLIMTFDPQIIALGGGLSGAGDFLTDACQRELKRIFSETTDPLFCSIRIAKHQNDAGIIGSAMLARYALADTIK